MEFIVEVFFEVIIGGILSVPGAFVRWLYFWLRGKPKSFKFCLKYNIELNILITVFLIILMVVSIN